MATVPSFTYKLAFLLVFVSIKLLGQNQISFQAVLPNELKEISGITKAGNNTYFTILDSGNEPIVYTINDEGQILKKTEIVNAKNKDWEAITSDNNGYIYIADLGNNENKREKLKIYKVRKVDLLNSSEAFAEEIEIKYADQKEFPPKSISKNYDVEALIALDKKLFIFTKNRTKPYSGYSYVYEIPSVPGEYKVNRVDSIKTGNSASLSWVTDAAMSPDLRHLVLLTQEDIILISDFYRYDFSSGYQQNIVQEHASQKEGICFTDGHNLFITDERNHGLGGNIYNLNIAPEIAAVDSIRKKEVSIPSLLFEDSLGVQIDLTIKAWVYFEIFDQNMKRIDFGKVGLFEKGENTFYITPKRIINASYMLNIIVANRPHGFFVRRFKEVDFEQLYKEEEKKQ